ncbi:MAG TPA: hypothetical protein VJL89_05430 [Thermodesulfovibrionia bacterium]|nr:hypothetical protein [Thermodesulfovibrionia bacterium]
MELTKESKIKLRLLSDGVIYNEAVKFIETEGTTTNSQISGLENIAIVAKKYSEIRNFSQNQAKKGRKLFESLTKKFDEIHQKTVSEYGVIKESEALTKKELNEQKDNYSLLVIREFIHHLSAHHRYKQER